METEKNHDPKIDQDQCGFSDAYFDGIRTFGVFGCSCEECRARYNAGFEAGLVALEKSLEKK
jgi:hypothetical protein